MKELNITIPENSSQQLMEKLDGCINKKQKGNKGLSKANRRSKEKIDHTYLFGKWKGYDIDAKKLREQSW